MVDEILVQSVELIGVGWLTVGDTLDLGLSTTEKVGILAPGHPGYLEVVVAVVSGAWDLLVGCQARAALILSLTGDNVYDAGSKLPYSAWNSSVTTSTCSTELVDMSSGVCFPQ